MVEAWLKNSKAETRIKPIYFYYFNHFNHFNHKYIPHVGSKKIKENIFFIYIYPPSKRKKRLKWLKSALEQVLMRVSASTILKNDG